MQRGVLSILPIVDSDILKYMAKEYTNETSIESYLLTDIDDSYSGQITEWIQAMSAHMDEYCNQSLVAPVSPVAETFRYDGDNTDTLIINTCNTLTEVRIDGVVTDVLTYPANKPYITKIVLSSGYFPCGKQNVEVEAIQSMLTEIPADLRFVATVLVAGIIQNQIMGMKAGTTETIGDYSITYKDKKQVADYELAMGILQKYKRFVL